MNWFEQKYIGLVSSRLERFRKVNQNLYNFRCPICGDSTSNRTKTRGYFFEKDDGGCLYHCHNCNITLGLEKFLQTIDPSLHSEFVKEKLVMLSGERPKTEVEIFAEKMKTPKFIKTTQLNTLKKISQLKFDHPAKLYVQKRKIPNRYHAKLFYAPKFKEFVNSIVPYKFGDIKYDEPRLVIPFLDKDKKLIGFQGRALKPDAQIRYITIMLDEKSPKIFNLDECDRSKTHYILEGPIDSMFVNNSIAMAGGSIDWNYVNENSVFVYDNEPRSKETCEKIDKIIKKNHKVVIWPEFIKQKDVNDVVLQNDRVDIDTVFRDNISSGLEAKICLTGWKRI